MTFGEYKFRFRLAPTLLLALPVPVLAGLGFWQLERAEEKREQARTLEAREEMAPLELRGLESDAPALRYRKVRAVGEFEGEGQFLIEHRRHANRAGFHVITPLPTGKVRADPKSPVSRFC